MITPEPAQILACAVVFLITLWALNKLLFRPIFQTMDEREGLTVKTQLEAARKVQYQESLYREFTERVKEEKQRGYQLAESIRREALDARTQRISQAKSEAEALLSKAKGQIAEEVGAAKELLKSEAEQMARIITARVLDES